MALTLSATAAPPRYDHVVIVIEENHSFTQIIGNRTSAPYINQLADGGVSFTKFYAVTHPSQPNYLEFFSGSNQDVVDDSRPRNPDGTLRYPFSTPNLGAELIAAGASFIGYSEDLPVAGDADTSGVSTVVNGVTYSLYRRKHNPWANWQDPTQGPDPVNPPPPNRLRPSTNQPFTAFPSDFTQLPDVAIVVPNEQNDMHDGTVRMGDDWLAANLSAYAEWAKTHNSLLIVMWDEDNFSGPNRIPTIFYGANLRPGICATTWTLHNLLRTIEDMIGTPHAGAAADVAPIAGVFASEPPTGIVTLQQGASGYAGAHDTQIRADLPANTFGDFARLTVDLDDNAATGDQPVQALIRFGELASRIPAGAPILSAKLILATGGVSGDTSVTAVRLHRMLVDWDETATWDSFTGGLAADGVKASATADFALKPTVLNAPAIFDVTNAVRDWLGGGTNRGWVLLPTSADGWRFSSSEEMTASLRPALEVTYAASVLEFSATTYAIDESGAGTAAITVMRNGWVGDAVSVQYATADGTATAPDDYGAASGTLTWPANDTASRTFTIPIVADSLVEADETVLLTLTAPTGAAVLTGRSAATLTIKETPFHNWLVAKFGAAANTPGIAGATADPDGDGQNNVTEFTAGTEPLDGASFFRASVSAGAVGGTHIMFTAQADRAYTVQFKDALTDPAWRKLVDVPAAAAARDIDVTDSTAASIQRFYRVVTPQQP